MSDQIKETEITVRKAPDDPACTRVSCGGSDKIGFYCTYRGSVPEAVKVLRQALFALSIMEEKKIEAPMNDQMRAIGEQGMS